ncbi:OmpA family protein [Joostella atrarenae]|uniref:OmpA family protein n=1 Tax=Joostella atrarenae TaxID=679257 RepID=A0ABS9J7C7_9FLAO|nr:OmpA family protein [Joostella atrarenae]MCF8716332.1 OmpA family protein [Joostella atrarenae]
MLSFKSFNTWVTVFMLFSFSTVSSQEAKLNRADASYKQLDYIKASEIYEEVANRGYQSVELFENLGNTFYFNAKYKEASRWYQKLFEMDSLVDRVYYRRYAQSLKAIGQDAESEKMFDTYLRLTGSISEVEFTSSEYLKLILENSGRYSIKNLSINTSGVDFGGFMHNGKLLFASTRDTLSLVKRKSSWDGLTFLDLYEVQFDSVNLEGLSNKIKGDVNTRFHESSGCITRDGKSLYFTRNNTTPIEKKGGSNIQRLKIYRSTLVNGKWTNIEDLSINSDNYSTAHPVLNSSEDKLYFVSDRPESIGATDIFYVNINPDGSLGKVENMGNVINTNGRESFPFVSERNELYFSSDGHYGLGGYDVFYTQLLENGEGAKSSILNVGKPINSSMDDISFSIDLNTHMGFISSNREGGLGYDDIYSFEETKDIRELIQGMIYGTVTDADTKKPIVNGKVDLYDENGSLFISALTDSEGNYVATTNRFMGYTVRVSKDEYSSKEISSINGEKEQKIDFELERNLYALTTGEDLAKMLGIKEIYFDFDKWNIRPNAEVELQKVLIAMEKYPNLKIVIKSYTDSRGDDSYNQILSERRSRATKEYLIHKGISKNRLSTFGYGESKLVNKCKNGILCTESEHQQNRRSEFIINYFK